MKLDWSRGFKVSTFRKKHRSAVAETIAAKQLTCEFDSETYLYHMLSDEAAKIQVKYDE